mmetsp:Transcript_18120/g.37566  ORF Transcript_18120/g.37566 Transcript_18120/m.37566 type:complete len:585 (+) Transcript_18120:135-1889(+)
MPRATLQSQLALSLLVVAVSMVLLLLHVHQASHFANTSKSNRSKGNDGTMPDNLKPMRAASTASELIKQDQRRREMNKINEEEKLDQPSVEIQAEEDRGPMNVVLFYADDWRHDTLGAAGNPIVKTPVLDALAKEGVRFTENCVTTSICWVSRATLYSGQYLARHHFEMLGKGRTVNGTEMKFEVPQNETLYSLLKKKANYHVGHAGKLGLWVELDHELNFDFFTDEDGWHWRIIGNKMWHVTEKNTADALRFLATRPKEKPFFLNVAYFATHAVDGDVRQYMPQNESMSMYVNDTIPIPATATEEAWGKMPPFFGEYNEGRTRWRWRFDTPEKHQHMMKNYYRMASEVDKSVGLVLNTLRDQGVLDNTLIIFTTDNGNFHAEHGLADKWYPHQESIRVPLIVKDPRMSPEFVGTTNDEFTLNIDLTATILGAAGLDPLPSMMGRDMSVLYRKGGIQTGAAAQGIPKISASNDERHYINSASDGQGKYHSGSESSWRTEFYYEHPMHSNPQYIPASQALVRKDYKYFYWPNFHYEQLFDIRNDPGEMNDLRNSNDPEHKEILAAMRKRFVELKMLAHSDLKIIL